jgi:ubiquinone/menaquinone biosynthesis C-methylase UbiE
MTQPTLQHGDYTGLGEAYSRYRAAYAENVLTALLALAGKPAAEIDAVDVGAGTGIWTRMLARAGCRSVIAVEPNNEMRRFGAADSADLAIEWHAGSGEATGLPDACCDFLTMASSFHWVDFKRGTRELHRVLRHGGRFVALWNPRLIKDNPLLLEIEDHLHSLKPGMTRVSSGHSGITERLSDMLRASPWFDDVIYIEGQHHASLLQEQYLGAWRSANDIQVQLGAEKFAEFINYVGKRISDLPTIETTYLTRAWAVRRS